jgi:hypothetical protein
MVQTTQGIEEGNGGIQRGAGGQAAGDTTQTMGAFAPGFPVGTAVNQQAVTPATGLRGLMALAPHFGEEEIGGMNARALFQTPGGMGFNNAAGVAGMGFNAVGTAGVGATAMGMAGVGETATGVAGENAVGTAGIGTMGGVNYNAMGMGGLGDAAMGMAGMGFNAAGAAGMGIAGGMAGFAAQAAGAAENGGGNGNQKSGTVLAALEKEIEKSKTKPDRYKKEFMWQKDYGRGRVADFKLDVLSPQFGIRALGVVQKGYPIIKVVHCIGKFLDIDGPGDLHKSNRFSLRKDSAGRACAVGDAR